MSAGQNGDTKLGDDAEEPKEGRYKLLCWAPSFLQCCNNAIGFVIYATIFYLFQTFVTGGLMNLNVSTLERRFGLNSTQSAVIVVGYDITFCVLALFVAYYGTKASRPKLVAVGAVVFAFGSFIYALPHITSPLYDYGNRQLQVVCASPFFNVTDLGCGQTNDLSWYMGILLLGSLLMGCGTVPMFTAGVAYIEDSVSKHKAPIYLGIINASSVIGPMIGFLVGGEFLIKLFTDFDQVSQSEHNLTLFDPRWVGAWWIGPLMASVVLFLVAIPLFGFPTQLPGTNRIRAARVSETHNYDGTAAARGQDFGVSIRDMPRAFWLIIKNPVFFATLVGGVFQAMIINGNSAFLTKFVENEFHLTVGRAGQLAGAVLIPPAAIGHVVAGIIINKMRWKVPAMLKFAAISLVIVVALTPVGFIHCKKLQVAGVSVPYIGDTLRVGDVNSACNTGCQCQEEFFIPVCGADKKTYFSPCHAGCFQPIFANGSTLPVSYGSCKCIDPPIPPNVTLTGTVTPGRCEESCTTLPGFLVAFFIVIFFSFTPLTPVLITQLRVVPESLRTFTMGVLWFFLRAAGSIPGPFIYGAVMDSTCLLWQERQCDGSRGSCWLYDNRKLAIGFITTSMVGNFLAAAFYFLGCLLYKPPVAVETSPDPEKKSVGGMTPVKSPTQFEITLSENPGFENDML